MRYGLIPETPMEETALEQAPHVRALFDPFLPLVAARALLAFVRLGVPGALESGARSTDQVATELDLDAEGLRHLLPVLAATGWVARTDGAWSLTPLSRATLVAGAPAQLDAWVAHNALHWRAVAELETALATKGDRDVHHRLESPEAWAIYQRAMLQTARPVAGAVAAALPEPPGRSTILDLGGSHGLYGAAICRRFAPMRCRVLDLPEAIDHARAVGETEGLADIVDYEAGDLLTTDLGAAAHDVAFLGNIVHHFDEAQLAGLLRRVHDSLRPGGIVAVWDMAPFAGETDPDLVAAAFSLLFHLTSASSCRPLETHVAALEAAGFVDVAARRDLSPLHTLITGRRHS